MVAAERICLWCSSTSAYAGVEVFTAAAHNSLRVNSNPMKKPPHIAVVGSANIDLTTFADRFPKAGETIFGRKFDLGFGGKGANQAVAARLCGAEVSMVARVGTDLFGPATIENFRKMGINTDYVHQSEGASSGVAPIFVEPDGQNRILVVKGANDLLKIADVEAAAEALKRADCILLQLEIPLETVLYCIDFAKRHNVPCLLNPAPAQALELPRLRGLDYFIPNETEAETISGIRIGDPQSARTCAEKLLSAGLKHVIITLGEKGSLLADNTGAEHVPSFEVETVDSSGAGDAFIGSFAVFRAEGASPREAVGRANLYAALSTTQLGTQKSFVDRSRFEMEWASRGTTTGASS